MPKNRFLSNKTAEDIDLRVERVLRELGNPEPPLGLQQVEAEANFAAGRLLFLREQFTDEARSLDPSIKAVQQLHLIFGNTLSTTLYRLVECVGATRPIAE